MTKTALIHEFTFNDSQITYQKFGTGPAAVLAFHGFGQSSQVFESLEKAIKERYTLFALNLFFHDNSRYSGDQLLTKSDWQRVMAAFLESQKIDRFSLMGFSLGGRFALATVEAFADRLDQLILIAPDGITRSFWYQLATGSFPGRKLFRYTLRHLPLLTAFGHTLTRFGLLHRTAMRFVEASLSTPEQRKLVYQSWTQFRLIQPDLTVIANLLIDKEIRIRFFTGAFDRIVPGSYILPLTKRLPHFELTILKTGHNHLIELMAKELN